MFWLQFMYQNTCSKKKYMCSKRLRTTTLIILIHFDINIINQHANCTNIVVIFRLSQHSVQIEIFNKIKQILENHHFDCLEKNCCYNTQICSAKHQYFRIELLCHSKQPSVLYYISKMVLSISICSDIYY